MPNNAYQKKCLASALCSPQLNKYTLSESFPVSTLSNVALSVGNIGYVLTVVIVRLSFHSTVSCPPEAVAELFGAAFVVVHTRLISPRRLSGETMYFPFDWSSVFILPALKDRIVFSALDGFARGTGRAPPPPRMDSRSCALLMVLDFLVCSCSLQIFWLRYLKRKAQKSLDTKSYVYREAYKRYVDTISTLLAVKHYIIGVHP